MQTMYVEAVREGASPTRAGLVQDFMKVECRECKASYRLFHDGAELKRLRDFFLQVSWQINREHPIHREVIVVGTHPAAAHRKAS